MRRTVIILILCTLLLATGLLGLWLAPASHVSTLYDVHLNRLIAILAFFVAGIAGMGGMLLTHLSFTQLTRDALRIAGEGSPRRLASDHPDLAPTVDAINSVLDESQQRIARADLHAKELEIQLKVVTAERQYLEAIIYSITDAVLVTDPYDEVVLANDSAARTFKFELGSAQRSPVHQVLHDPVMVGLIQEMRQSHSKSGRRILEHAIAGDEGQRTYKVTLSCIRAHGQQPSGVVAVLHDMTREKEVAQMKSEFVSNVSHELRTPLASIKAYAEMLIDGEAADDKTAHEFYEVIHNEANRLGRLIDNILNLSRIESGLVKVNKHPQSLMVLLKEATEVITPQARQKQIVISETIAPALFQVLADRDMLYEAILNLLSNAVKYTPENGQITVRMEVDESKKNATVRISDTGVGIPQKDLPFIFDKFYRSEANNRMAKGTGLGLSLVKHIIETVHHGRLFVESQVGKGSTFGFELDLIE